MNSQTYSENRVIIAPNWPKAVHRVSQVTTTEFINNFAKVVRRSGLCSLWQMRGCWGSEILNVERHFGLLLPEIYIDFLKKMGRGAGNFFENIDIFCKDVFKLRLSLVKTLKRDGDVFTLPAETFVFSGEKGRVFYFFDTSDCREDPPVYGYATGDRHIRLINETFSGFLIESLAEQKESRANDKKFSKLVLAD